MTTKEVPTNQAGLEKAIDSLLSEMQGFSGDTEEYGKMATQLERLYKLKEIDAPRRVSPDTLATVITNLAGILLIIKYERLNIITSKALGFVAKLR